MNELKVISEIDEESKSIVYAAKNNSLTAINALLVAKQAGMKAIGFSVVAHELIWSQITSRFAGAVGGALAATEGLEVAAKAPPSQAIGNRKAISVATRGRADMKQWSEKR